MGDLAGWTVVVTRAEGPDGPLAVALARQGADVVYVPTVEMGPPEDPGALDAALDALHEIDWIVFTSPRAVDALVASGAVVPEGTRVAAVGSATADRARAAGFPVSVVGEGGGAEALAEALVAHGVGRGDRVLFPASSRAGPDLSRLLGAAGAEVRRGDAYRTRVRSFDPARIPELARADVVTFTSPSAVEGWRAATAGEAARFVADGVRYVVIGETTGAALEAHGLTPVVAQETSLDGMVEAVRALAHNEEG